MAERKRNRRKKDDDSKDDEKPNPTEYDVAKYLRSKLPEKQTTLLSHKVNYFIASKAIDCLLDSSWATKKDKNGEVLFTSRDTIVDFLDLMLRHKFFHRAKKIVVQKDKKKKKDDDADDGKKKKKEDDMDEGRKRRKEDETDDGKKKKKDVENEEAKSKKKEEDTGSGETKTKKDDTNKKKEDKSKKSKDDKKDTDEKKKKKIKLDMHLEQVFVDGNEPFVWIYDPIPVRAWIIGTLMVVGAVLVCLFPLWPKIVRHYVYYLSVAAAGFLVFIIALAVIRLVVFVLVWLFTFGKHHLWLLPNLTEDVGFFESFWPLYKYEYKGKEDKEEESNTDQEGKDSDAGESEQDIEREFKDTQDNGFEILDPNGESDHDNQES